MHAHVRRVKPLTGCLTCYSICVCNVWDAYCLKSNLGGEGGGCWGGGGRGHLLTLHISHYMFCLVSIPGNIPEQPYPPQGEALFAANSHFRVSGPVCIFASCLHTTITHGIELLEPRNLT